MSSSSLTTAALAQHTSSSNSKITPQTSTAADKQLSNHNSAKKKDAANDNTAETSYHPPELSPSSFPASPLSPSTSNSDVEGTYIPPSLPGLQLPAQNALHSPGASKKTGDNLKPPSSLMVESTEGTSQNQAGEPLSRRAAHRLGSGYKKATTPGSGTRSNHNMLRLNSEQEFQQKLSRIGSDILSVSYDASYDDNDVDATFVEVEDGIEEEDNEDGASV